MAAGRRTQIAVTWLGVGITADIASHIAALRWTDNLSGAADDLTLEMQDRDGLWRGDWRPTYGDSCTASITAEPWLTEVETLDLGTFAHDKITVSGPPNRVSIKAVSAPLSTGLRRRKRTRAWQGMSLWSIAYDITGRAGLELSLEGDDTAKYRRREQKNESDLEFLEKLCKESGRGLKVTDGKIAIFDEYEREQSASVGEIDLARDAETKRVLNWSFDGDDSARYGACRVTYMNPRTGKKIVGEYADANNADGQTLELNRPVETIAEAQAQAEAFLRNANRYATSGRLAVLGDPGLVAGVTFDLVGAGPLDGKFIITKASHRPIGGYECALEVRRCLEGF